MNTDIRISTGFPSHLKTRKLILLAGQCSPWNLIQLWIFTATNKPSGILTDMDGIDIEIASGWSGEVSLFCSSLLKCKFLDLENSQYKIHDWIQNNPWAANASERSNKARFSKLASLNPEEYSKLKELGVNAVTADEYHEIANRQRTVNDNQRTVNESSTPTPTPTPIPAPTKKANSISSAKKPRRSKISDDEFIEELKKNPAISHLNIDHEINKMKIWLLDKPGRELTRRFITNWLLKDNNKPVEIKSNEEYQGSTEVCL